MRNVVKSWLAFFVIFHYTTALKTYVLMLKVSKFQNEFMKSSFRSKYVPILYWISALYCATLLQLGRNPYNFWLIFWEKQ